MKHPLQFLISRLTDLAFRSRSKRGSALLIILGFVTLMTVLVVSLLLTTRFERTASSLALGRTQAGVLADYGAEVAMERLREAIDDGRQFNSSRYTTWASEPGRIHVFTITQGSGAISREARDMFSAPPGPDAEAANVDLNKAGLSGIHPITGTAPGVMKVGWINVLADPSQAASKTNPASGRIAFWVDDESCKVNINTADGSKKVAYNSDGSVKSGDITRSFGFGTPSEISLEAFGISKAIAADIAEHAVQKGFNSAAEVSLVQSVPSEFPVDNRFSLTHTSRTPEINMFGEPRIYLFPVQKYSASTYARSVAAGGYGSGVATSSASASIYEEVSTPINFIYPCSAMTPILVGWMPGSQLPVVPAAVTGSVSLPLPQCLTQWGGASTQGSNWNSGLTNYPLGMRIAQYLKGKNSQNNAITWPRFDGATVNGFAGKFSDRQIDSIALQVLDLASAINVLNDQGHAYSQPSYSVRGFLNAGSTAAKLVYGLGRSPKANEIQIAAEATATSTAPTLKMKIMLECFVPRGYVGPPLKFGNDALQLDSDGTVHIPHALNQQDRPYYVNNDPVENATISSLDTWWMNGMLQIKDQTGVNFSGVDLFGMPSGGYDASGVSTPMYDRDQTSAELYHPFVSNNGPGTYVGDNDVPQKGKANPEGFNVPSPGDQNKKMLPLLAMPGMAPGITGYWAAGAYHASPNLYGDYTRHGAPSVTSFLVRGGLALWTRTGSGGGTFWEIAPLDSLRGTYTGEGATWKNNTSGRHWTGTVDASIKSFVTDQAVIPVNFDLPVTSRKTYTLQVSDPLVNKFPADWRPVASSEASIPAWVTGSNIQKYPLSSPNPDFPYPSGYGSNSFNGDNAGYKPSGGGDPLSLWLPPQDIRMPKQARLPSVGALNYIRTGMIPDDETVPLSQQSGVPWRSLSFDSTTAAGQSTANGTNIYPDWAILDLFTVPFHPQRPYMGGVETATPLRVLTSSGSTEGRLNINNPKSPYPFSSAETYPGVARTPYPERTMPLQSLFYGIETSNSYTPQGDPIYSAVNAVTLADEVQEYLSTAGPFMLPGQLAEVPALAAYTYTAKYVDPNDNTKDKEVRSRNDLLKNVIGATTTQSNTFSIWVVAQTFRKAAKNADYSKFEPGDIVTGEIRKRFIVERFIETGTDGVPGNVVALTPKTSNPTNDGLPATPDDPIDPNYHPAMAYPLPYRFKILSGEEIAL